MAPSRSDESIGTEGGDLVLGDPDGCFTTTKVAYP